MVVEGEQRSSRDQPRSSSPPGNQWPLTWVSYVQFYCPVQFVDEGWSCTHELCEQSSIFPHTRHTPNLIVCAISHFRLFDGPKKGIVSSQIFWKRKLQKARICGTKFWPNHLRTRNLPECTMSVTGQATPTRFMIYKLDRFRRLAPITHKCEVLSLLNGKERWFFFWELYESMSDLESENKKVTSVALNR